MSKKKKVNKHTDYKAKQSSGLDGYLVLLRQTVDDTPLGFFANRDEAIKFADNSDGMPSPEIMSIYGDACSSPIAVQIIEFSKGIAALHDDTLGRKTSSSRFLRPFLRVDAIPCVRYTRAFASGLRCGCHGPAGVGLSAIPSHLRRLAVGAGNPGMQSQHASEYGSHRTPCTVYWGRACCHRRGWLSVAEALGVTHTLRPWPLSIPVPRSELSVWLAQSVPPQLRFRESMLVNR